MSTISFHASDTIFATINSGSRTLARLTLSGFTSMAELMQSLVKQLRGVVGLVTIDLRNCTNGWSVRQALFVKA